MVQPSSRLRLSQTARRGRRRGRVRPHGDCALVESARIAAGPAAPGADRAQRQGLDRNRAARGRRGLVLAGALVALIACSPQAPAQNAPSDAVTADSRAQSGLREAPLTIRSKTGVHHFTVEVAATESQPERGLMSRHSLDGRSGMVFPYDPPQNVSFWMKNTLIPLDIIYVRPNGTIARIINAEPMD